MKKATTILSNEHRVIEVLLSCLDELARRADASGDVDADAARDALHVVTTFADTCHHAKEEEALFPLLLRRGMPAQQGPIQVMLQEHEQGREYVSRMKDALDDAQAFARAVRGYTALLRDHIAKEDECLFTMADQMITPQDDEALLLAFADHEREGPGPGEHEACLNTVRRLARELGVAQAAELAESVPEGSCGHHG